MTRPQKVRWLLWPSAFMVGLAGSILVLREPTELLTQETLNRAREQWRGLAARDYDLVYRMHGSDYAVRVRDGWVVDARVNGRQATAADIQSYSMDGLFDLLDLELENTRKSAIPPELPDTPGQAMLRVRFHPELGYIEKYLRSGNGAMRGTAIEINAFARTHGSK